MTERIVAITTTKTSRAQGSAEYWLKDHSNDYLTTLQAARADHPRKRKFFELVTADGWSMSARQITVSK